MSTPSPWKRVFDLVDARVSPVINELARSQDVAVLLALGVRAQREVERRAEQLSRRALHLLNLPAGSDVNRLLDHIARLEREVSDLRAELTDREVAAYLAELAERHETAQAAGSSNPVNAATGADAPIAPAKGGAHARARAHRPAATSAA
ncbi:MAG: hypothetical protein ACKO91_11275 [Acidimicrobiales bacterium]